MANRKSPSPAGAALSVDEFKNHAVARLLRMRVVSATRKQVVGEMHITPAHINRSGRVGGGLIMAFADILGARGTVANLPPGARTATMESKTNFFAAGTGPVMSGVSIPLHIGRTTMVWQTTVSNDDKRRVAIVTQTQIVMAAATGKTWAPDAAPASGLAPAKRGGRTKKR